MGFKLMYGVSTCGSQVLVCSNLKNVGKYGKIISGQLFPKYYAENMGGGGI